METKLRVAIVEDEPAIARSVKLLLMQLSDAFTVCGIAYNGADGLELIKKEKPDIVFSDICMPMMSGLEMIEEAVRLGISAEYIILSGYSEFEYAKTAISIGVSEYLLKPIIPDEMEKLLKKLTKQYRENEREVLSKYVQDMLLKPHDNEEVHNPFSAYDCVFLFSYYGPVTNTLCGDMNVGRDAVNMLDDGFVSELEEIYGIYLLQIKRWYYNEVIYILAMPHQKEWNMKKMIQDLWERIQSPQIYTNLMVSERIMKGEKMAGVIEKCNLFTLFHIPFGRSGIHKCSSWKTENIGVSEEIVSQCRQHSGNITHLQLKNLTEDLAGFWEERKVTQLQLQTDIRYCLGYFSAFDGINQKYPVNAEDIIFSSSTFEDIKNTMLMELEELLNIKEQNVDNPVNKNIIYQVKIFLDQNYTQNISAKRIYEEFGYNEKYIASLFKTEFGITPGKYVGELRMNKAKKLMCEDPYILLKDVAVQVGYMDSLYFSRVFKGREGESPSQYQQRIREKLEMEALHGH